MAWDDDKPLPEDAEIDAVFPTRSERHDIYAEAMRMVGAKRSKGAIVALVNWLLHRIETAEREREEAREQIPHPGDGSCERCAAVPTSEVRLCNDCLETLVRGNP